jgi:short-subunit dehydrogenase
MELDRSSVALVTGGSGGIGAAIARALHRAGARVVITGRREGALAELAGEIGAKVVVADLARADAPKQIADEVGPIDVLVANAALPASGELFGYTEEEIDRALAVNLRAPILLARYFGEQMATRGRGQIVFISSLAGKMASPGIPLYTATKFGMRGFSLVLREDLKKHGVGVTTVSPGFIRDAGMFADTKIELPSGVGTRSPEDVARAVLRAVRSNPAEIDVASLIPRVTAFFGTLTPGLVNGVQKMFGAEKLSHRIGEAQRAKR